MSLIEVYLPYFRGLVKDSRFKSEEGFNPVFYYRIPTQLEKGEEVYFYKLIGSNVFGVRVLSSSLPENITVEGLKQEFEAEEIPRPLYNYYIELTGRQFL